MKKFYLLILTSLITLFSFAGTTVTAIKNNGLWTSASTWNTNKIPSSSDSVVIPQNIKVVIDQGITLNNVAINVLGTLQFQYIFSYLALNSASDINVGASGLIDGTLAGWQYIFLGSNTVFYGTDITGPVVANASTGSAFLPIGSSALPVKFIAFDATKRNTDVQISWSTAQEVNANMYEVERSNDGGNWKTIAYVAAAGNSKEVNAYAFTDKNNSADVSYYRIRQVDFSGKFTYTAVKVIKSTSTVTATSAVNIVASTSNTWIQFPTQVKGNVVVSVVSLSGQVLSKQVLSNPVGQVALNNSSLKGHYIIAVSNGQDLNVAKQILL